eukprot:5955695-Pleurochrysis_carterae.AAC.2
MPAATGAKMEATRRLEAANSGHPCTVVRYAPMVGDPTQALQTTNPRQATRGGKDRLTDRARTDKAAGQKMT